MSLPPRRTQQVYASGYPGFFVEDQVLAYLDAIAKRPGDAYDFERQRYSPAVKSIQQD